jgi:hypothetical protein
MPKKPVAAARQGRLAAKAPGQNANGHRKTDKPKGKAARTAT